MKPIRRSRLNEFLFLIFAVVLSGVQALPFSGQSQTELQEATLLNQQADKLYQSGNYEKAVPLYERALKIVKKALGPEHPNTAFAISNLAGAYDAMDNYEMALPLISRVLAIRQKALGIEHPDTISALNNLALTYHHMGNNVKALPLQERALAGYKKIMGPEHLDTVRAMDNLASIHYGMGNLGKALLLQERVLAIREKVLGPEQLDTVGGLNDLALTCRAMGNYGKALLLQKRVLTIREKVLGPEHLDSVHALNNLAGIYFEMGNYVKASPLYARALAVREKVLGPEHWDTAKSLNNLAAIYQAMGNDGKAVLLQEHALAIDEKVLGPEHPDTARSLNNLAVNYYGMGNYGKALLLGERALAIDEKVLGPEHPDTIDDLKNLAGIYQAMGEYGKALLLGERALAIDEKILGPEHPDTAKSLNNLALTYHNMGNYGKALLLEDRALAIREKTLGAEQPATLISCECKVLFQLLAGSDLASINESLARVYSGKEKSLESVLAMDESTRLSWQKKNLNNTMIDLLRREQKCQFILRTKGIVLDSMIEDQAALKSLGEETPEAYEVTSARLRIGKLAFSTKKEDQEEVARLKSRIDTILSGAAEQRVKIGRVRTAATITPDTVATDLPAGGVLIEFIQFTDPKIKGDAGRCYGALVLGRDGESKFVRIDDAARIDASIRSLREAIARGDEKSLAGQQKLLADKLWAPIVRNLPEGTKKLFIGADGQLNFLSFAALPAPDGSFLAEHYDIAYVGSGRDLARKVTPSDSKSICLFADPIFDRQASAFSTNALALRSGEVDAFGKIVLPPLPGTRAEEAAVEEVAKAGGWNPNARLGEAASKSAIMDIKSPGILHLATHGFYLNTLPANGAEGERGMMLMEAADSRKPAPPPKIDPMHASGIALTGAQSTLKAWSEGRVPDPKEDGILTAEEVGALNLDGTWLVTLSACETGVGEARSGEGVFGLRRAFMIAGAQNLLMTLWPVSDEVTPKIMADFYKEALATHDAAGSLAKVQRDWLVKLRKEKGLLAAVRDAGPFAMVVMAKQDSTFSSPSIATPIAAPLTPTNSPVPAVSPSSIPVPVPSVPQQPAPGPSPTPSPDASPSATSVLSEQTPLKKAA